MADGVLQPDPNVHQRNVRGHRGDIQRHHEHHVLPYDRDLLRPARESMRHRRPGAQRDVLRRRRDFARLRRVCAQTGALQARIWRRQTRFRRRERIEPKSPRAAASRAPLRLRRLVRTQRDDRGRRASAPEAAQVGRSPRRLRPEGIRRRRIRRRPRHRRRGVVPVGKRAGDQTLEHERGVA